MKITVKLFDKNCKFESINKGDWVDLRSSIDLNYQAPIADRLTKNKTVRKVNFGSYIVPLGIAMKIPQGFEAIIAPRSSSYKNYGFIQTNSIGIIDGGEQGYCGPNDEWMLPISPLKDGKIKQYDRIAQFKIQPSQKATILQKLKWLFTNKIEFEFVNEFDGEDRGGFGSTGTN